MSAASCLPPASLELAGLGSAPRTTAWGGVLCIWRHMLSSLPTLVLLSPPAARRYLVIKRPWPSMMRTVAGDHARFEQTYFSHYKVPQACCEGWVACCGFGSALAGRARPCLLRPTASLPLPFFSSPGLLLHGGWSAPRRGRVRERRVPRCWLAGRALCMRRALAGAPHLLTLRRLPLLLPFLLSPAATTGSWAAWTT